MTTLADMTQGERAQCKGLWCSYETPTGKRTAIIHDFPLGDIREKETVLFDPLWGYVRYKNSDITLRDDLPKAWNPDGTPPLGKWEDDYTDAEGSTLTTGEDLDIGPHQEIHRWIGNWEQS